MSRFRCNTCKGEYDDVDARGSAYYHVCPPVEVVRFIDDTGATRALPFRALAGITLVGTAAERDALIAAGADPTTVYIELGRRYAPRRDARDENTLRRDGAHGEIRVLKASGTGATPIAPLPAGEAPVADAP